MMTKPKTHRQRAEEAVRHHEENRHRYVLGDEDPEGEVDAVARITYPTELVKAAQALLDRAEGIVLVDKGEDDRLARDEERLRVALAPYEPEAGA